MNQPTVNSPDTEDTETLFRRIMAGATDMAWNLGIDEEALAALHDVIDEGTRRKESGENRRDHLPQ